jgi:hypothetical protein
MFPECEPNAREVLSVWPRDDEAARVQFPFPFKRRAAPTKMVNLMRV